MGMEISQYAERRKFQRLEDNIFILGALKANHAAEFKAFTRDISGGGLMFETDSNIPAGSELELEIYQPSDSGKRIIFSVHIIAKVAWTRAIEKDAFEEGENRYQVGVEFSEIKEEDRQRIANFVNGSMT